MERAVRKNLTAQPKLSHTLTLWVSLISQTRQQPLHTDIFIQGIPVNTMNTQLIIFAAGTISVQQTGKPNQRRTHRSAIGQQNPKVILIKPDFLRRNSHATHPPGVNGNSFLATDTHGPTRTKN